ncbi:maleylpyruvate isomerase family mycothiol-dependent enzyme [Mycolicibacterium baixiangningiae]|uniref:maleylpyruvate isomerase family mycothiol-dependent enzyme n=1 Tax=Mycolicibacterium baixiangningiae TaxID=2761578 RepID=UPI0018D14AD3|nr:maleylpyruvate isomerase family mycothiol-dependent enzyme [Mycolicibacterium baixiangningiae]
MQSDDIWAHIDAERADLADFLDTLTPGQWATPSLCADWTVRDVAVHLTQSTTSWPRLGWQAVRSGFRFDAMVSRAAREDPRTPDEIVAALRAMAGVRRRPPGTAVADPLADALVHGQDIAVPLGIDRPMPVGPAVIAAKRLWTMGFPFHARKRFAGIELRGADADFAVGSGRPVVAPIRDIVLALSGRNSAVSPRV